MIDDVLVPEHDADDTLADERARRVLDQVLVAGIAEPGGEPVDQPDRLVDGTQQQRTGIRRDRTAAEIGDDDAALDPSEFERILATLCRHRGASQFSVKSLQHNHFR